MTNDQPIRFRTFADEDDTVWREPAGAAAHPLGRGPVFASEEPTLGAALPLSGERLPRGPAFLAWGTGLALVAGVAIAVSLLPKPGVVSADDAPAAPGLQVHRYVAPQPGGLAASATLPCFVNGAPAGSLTVADCGRRNGVASGRLDVGLNQAAAVTPASPPVEAYADRRPPMVDPYVKPVARRSQLPAVAQSSFAAPLDRDEPAPAQTRRPVAPPYAGDAPHSGLYAAVTPRGGDYGDEDRSDNAGVSPEDSVRAVQTFYEGLGEADGARAASVVVPEKRRQGPLSAGSIDRFYSGLRAPLRLTRLYPVDDHTVVARYNFVDRDGGVCQGSARVTTTERDGEVYVEGVRALNGC